MVDHIDNVIRHNHCHVVNVRILLQQRQQQHKPSQSQSPLSKMHAVELTKMLVIAASSKALL